MVTGFDLLHHNKPLQKHWLKRVIAYIIDIFLSSIGAYAVFTIISFGLGPTVFIYFPLVAGLIQVFYSAIFESLLGYTVGKRILDLEVESLQQELDISKTLVRNVTKVHGLLLFLDWIAGMIVEGDPRQRYLDRIANTTVIGGSEPLHLPHFIAGRSVDSEE